MINQGKIVMISKCTLYIYSLVMFLLMAGCVRNSDDPRNNPWDGGGTNFTNNQPPQNLTVDTGSRWFDYNFINGTGALIIRYRATDPNGKYDTLRYTICLDTVNGTADTIVKNIQDTAAIIFNIKPGQKCYYSITVKDRFDSSLTKNGSFSALTGLPPQPPIVTNSSISSSESSISLTWSYPGVADSFKIYRRDSLTQRTFHYVGAQPYTGTSPYTYSDFVPDYAFHYYSIAAANKYGQSLTSLVLEGRRFYLGINTPRINSVSQSSYYDSIYITWSPVTSATYYELYKTLSLASNPYKRIAKVSGLLYFYDTVYTGENCYYRVAAFDAQGRGSTLSAPTLGYFIRPVTPSVISASTSYYDYIQISWISVSGSSGYNIYRSDSATGTYKKIASTTSASYKDSVAETRNYYYKVTAYNTKGRESSMSAVAGGNLSKISTPSNVSASNGTYYDYIQVSWSSVSSATGYNVYCADSVNGIFKKISSSTLTQYNDSVTSTQSFYYKVAAYDSKGREGDLSYYASGYIQRLSSPSGFTASQGAYSGYIQLSWSSVTGAVKYYIYRSVFSSGPYSIIDSITTTLYRDSSIQDLKQYYYLATAVDSKGRPGAPSPYAYGYKRAFSYPSNFTASYNTYKSHVLLTWTSESGAVSYIIYRSSYSSNSMSYYKTLATLTSDTLYRDSAISADSTYYYLIAATNSSGLKVTSSSYISGKTLTYPKGLSASNSSSYNYLSWSSMSGIYGYVIFRSTDSLTYTRLDTTTSYSYNDYVTDTKKYYYKIAAFSIYDESIPSPAVSAQKLPTPPSSVSATGYKNYVSLSWSIVTGISSYAVYRNTSNSTGSAVLLVTSSSTAYKDSSAASGQKYYYWVRSIGTDAVMSAFSSYAYAGLLEAPLAPTNLSTTGYSSYIKVLWSPNTSGSPATQFYIYRADSSSGLYSKIDSISLTYYSDYAVSSGKTYYYKISGWNTSGEGVLSSYTSGKLPGPLPPQSITASYEKYTTHIEITWSAVSGVSGYSLYRSTTSTGMYSKIGTSTATVYNDSTGIETTVYYYKVASFNSSIEGDMSVFVSGKKKPVLASARID
jgi:fibronectin type 3 domain-containing protein